MGYIPTRVIYVAAKLEIADHISDAGASAPELAKKLNVHPDALYRVLRTLAGLGVLHQDENDRFFVTQFGETLRKDSLQSVRDYAIYSHEFSYHRMSKIMDSVRTGKPVMEDFFENLRADPEQRAIFYAHPPIRRTSCILALCFPVVYLSEVFSRSHQTVCLGHRRLAGRHPHGRQTRVVCPVQIGFQLGFVFVPHGVGLLSQ